MNNKKKRFLDESFLFLENKVKKSLHIVGEEGRGKNGGTQRNTQKSQNHTAFSFSSSLSAS
jgi:hypothetical protein